VQPKTIKSKKTSSKGRKGKTGGDEEGEEVDVDVDSGEGPVSKKRLPKPQYVPSLVVFSSDRS